MYLISFYYYKSFICISGYISTCFSYNYHTIFINYFFMFWGEKQRMFQSILLSLLDFIASINYLWQFQIFVFIICCCCFSVCLMFFLSIFLYASSKKELIFHHEVEKIRPNVLTYPILL